MGTLRYITDYILPPVLDDLDETKSKRVKLDNQRLVISEDGFYQDPEHGYPYLVFIDDIIDDDYGYTMAYNAKVGTVIPILASNYDRFKEEWLVCDGHNYFKEDYPMLFNKIKDVFYEENAIGDEIPLYINEFVLPNLLPRKLDSESDDKIIFIIKASRKPQGNHYDKDDDLT